MAKADENQLSFDDLEGTVDAAQETFDPESALYPVMVDQEYINRILSKEDAKYTLYGMHNTIIKGPFKGREITVKNMPIEILSSLTDDERIALFRSFWDVKGHISDKTMEDFAKTMQICIETGYDLMTSRYFEDYDYQDESTLKDRLSETSDKAKADFLELLSSPKREPEGKDWLGPTGGFPIPNEKAGKWEYIERIANYLRTRQKELKQNTEN